VITVRRACADDSDAVWRIFQDESSYAGTLQTPYPSRDVWRKRVAEPPESDFMLVALADGEVVGHAGLHKTASSPRRAHAMLLGIAVRADWQGKGVGRALMKALTDLADDWLPVVRIELTVFVDNERAIKLYRDFGFEIEGTHKAYALRDGRYTDTYAMARIRPKPAP
jgi:putative acetyltransferase